MFSPATGYGVERGAPRHYNRPLMITTTMLEREIKLRYDSVESARAAVLATGATPPARRRLTGRLAHCSHRRRDAAPALCALRIRAENGKSRITFKGAVQPSQMKVRRSSRRLSRRELLLQFSSSSCSTSGSATRSIARSLRTRRRSSRSTRPGWVFVESRAAGTRDYGDWPGRSDPARPTTCSIPTAGCSSSSRRVRALRHDMGVRPPA